MVGPFFYRRPEHQVKSGQDIRIPETTEKRSSRNLATGWNPPFLAACLLEVIQKG